jgi:hypothetical protein
MNSLDALAAVRENAIVRVPAPIAPDVSAVAAGFPEDQDHRGLSR